MKITIFDTAQIEDWKATGSFIKESFEMLGHTVYLNEFKEADFALIIKGEHESLDRIVKFYKRVALWYWEPPLWDWFIKKLNFLMENNVRIFCSSKVTLDSLNYQHSYLLPQGVHLPVHFPMSGRKENVVLFIGNRTEKRDEWLDEIEKHFTVRKFGRGYEKEVYNEEFSKEVAKAKVCIELPPDTSPNYSKIDFNLRHYSVRPFMYMAAKGYVLMYENEDFKNLFDRYEFMMYNNLSECIIKIGLLMEMNSVNAVEVMYSQVIKKHNYLKRCSEMIGVMDYEVSG